MFIKQHENFVDENLISNKKYCEYGDLLITKTSEDLENSGKHAVYLGQQRMLVGGDIEVIKHKQNPRYLAYALQTDFCRVQMKRHSFGGLIVHIYSRKIKQIQIPLPSLDEQEKIVSILDKFHELCGDITTGIPTIIEGTEKQYQYYRDKIIN